MTNTESILCEVKVYEYLMAVNSSFIKGIKKNLVRNN